MSTRVDYGQRRVKVTPEAIEALLVNESVVRTGLPDDARFVRLWQSDHGECYYLVFESLEWDELAEGEEIPLLVPEVEWVEEEDR